MQKLSKQKTWSLSKFTAESNGWFQKVQNPEIFIHITHVCWSHVKKQFKNMFMFIIIYFKKQT